MGAFITVKYLRGVAGYYFMVVKNISNNRIPISSLETLPLLEGLNYEIINFRDENPKYIIRKKVDNLFEKCNRLGFDPSLYTAFYEGILNSYQHGNNRDKDKKIFLGHDINRSSAELVIHDYAKNLPSCFFQYIEILKNQNIFWYDFSLEKQKQENLGTGIFFLNLYSDKLDFYRSPITGGLATYLYKSNPNIK